MQHNHYQLVALSERRVTIIYWTLQQHTQMKATNKNVNNPFFIKF